MSIVEVVRKTTTVVEVAHPGVQGPPGSGGSGGAVDSVNGRAGPVVLTSADVGLSNVNNTSDASKPVSTAQAAADSAVLASANATTAAHAARTDNPHTVTAVQLGLGNVENKSSATIRGEITSGNVTTALGFTPENAAQKGAAGGYAPLDGTGKVASTYLPSTDAVTEGASNLYFTAARVLATVLSGLSTATNAVITAADTVLSALGKLQKQISDNLTTLTSHTGNTSNPHSTTAAQVGAAASGAVATSGLTMSTNKLLGRNTASTGAIEEITLGTNLSFSGTTLNATGGGSPGGSTTQVQYNNAGAFAGMSGWSWDDTNRALTATGATVTTSKPLYWGTQTWNNASTAFTAFGYDITLTAFNAGGSKALKITYNSGAGTYLSIDANSGLTSLIAATTTGRVTAGTDVVVSNGLLYLNSAGDTAIKRNAAGVAEINNGTGGTFRDLKLRSLISSGGVITLSSYTVATLPTAASNTHAIVAVTDGNASPTYRGAVTGGGSTKGVVYCDGSSWMWH